MEPIWRYRSILSGYFFGKKSRFSLLFLKKIFMGDLKIMLTLENCELGIYPRHILMIVLQNVRMWYWASISLLNNSGNCIHTIWLHTMY